MINIIHKFIFSLFLLCVLGACINNDVQALNMESHKGQAIGAGRAVLVTGASSGIGKKIALTLAENGFHVYAGARKSGDIKSLSQLPNITGVRLDVTVQKDIDAAVKTIESAGRGLYGLVNNAGVFLFDPLIEVSESDLEFILDVNVMGPYRITQAFAPMIIKSKGRISNISSVAGLFSGQLFGPYGMSKFAVEAYSEALAGEMKKFNVAVSVVEPGNFKSDIMKNMAARIIALYEGRDKSLYEEEIKRFAGFSQADRSQHADPLPVALAVVDFMTQKTTQFRYLVTPNKNEADMTINRLVSKLIDINQGQRFPMTEAQLLNAFTAAVSLDKK